MFKLGLDLTSSTKNFLIAGHNKVSLVGYLQSMIGFGKPLLNIAKIGFVPKGKE